MSSNIGRFTLIFILCLLAGGISADDLVQWDYMPYFSVNYSRDTGLPHLNMDSMIQDRLGFLYFKTKTRGFYKYDGHTWRSFTWENSGLIDNRIADMTYDGKDKIYIIHPVDRVSIFNILTEELEIIPLNAPFLGLEINKVRIYPEGFLCITNAFHGMFHLELATGKNTYFTGSNPQLNIFGNGWQNISAIFTDSEERCWVGSSRGVMLFNGKEFYAYFPFSDNDMKEVLQIIELADKEILIITDRSLGLVNLEKGIIEECSLFPFFSEGLHTFCSAQNTSMLYDRKGRLIFASSGGIRILEPGTGRSFEINQENNMLISNAINSLFLDREGSIWVLTENGITKLRETQFINYSKIQNIHVANIYEYQRDNTSNVIMPQFKNNLFGCWLYFSGDYFIAELFREGYKVMDFSYLNRNPSLRHIFLMNEKVFIEPLWTSGFYSYSSETQRFLPDKYTFYSDQVLDYKGKLYRYYSNMTNFQQLHITDKATGIVKKIWLDSDLGFFANTVELFVDKEDENKIWIIHRSNNAAAIYYDIKEEKHYYWSPASAAKAVLNQIVGPLDLNIIPDNKGSFWVNIRDNMLHFENNQLIDYTERLMLQNKEIVDADSDGNGRLFIATKNSGLVVYDWTSAVNYTIAEGLTGDSLSRGVAISRDGAVFVMSRTVLSMFVENSIQKPVFNFQFHRVLDLDRKNPEIYLSSSPDPAVFLKEYRNLSLYVSANSYLSEKDLQYTFKIDSENWEPRGNANFINLTGLSEGTHKISARVTDHLNRTDSTTYTFYILPYWFELPAIRILTALASILLISGILILFVKLYTIRLKKRSLLLEATIEERTAQLKETQHELIRAANLAGRADIASEVLHSIGNMLNSLSIRIEMVLGLHKEYPVSKFQKTNSLIEQEALIPENAHPRLRQAIQFYNLLGAEIKKIHDHQEMNLSFIQDKIEQLKFIIKKQEEFASYNYFSESIDLVMVMEDTLDFLADEKGEIQIKKIFRDDKIIVTGQKTKILYILITICRFSIQRLKNIHEGNKLITIEISSLKKGAVIRITDNGRQVDEEEVQSIFKMEPQIQNEVSLGEEPPPLFTGHTIHTCANFMTEMGGRISLSSAGLEKGSCFILEFGI